MISGEVAESPIDHIYYSQQIKNIELRKLKQSATDHVPILCEIKYRKFFTKYILNVRKRCYKNYSKERWNECLSKKDWSRMENQDLNSMVETFTTFTNEALDEVAPFKTFKIRSQ